MPTRTERGHAHFLKSSNVQDRDLGVLVDHSMKALTQQWHKQIGMMCFAFGILDMALNSPSHKAYC